MVLNASESTTEFTAAASTPESDVIEKCQERSGKSDCWTGGSASDRRDLTHATLEIRESVVVEFERSEFIKTIPIVSKILKPI